MKTQWKIVIGIIGAVVALGGTVASVRWSQSAQVTVQTATVTHGDLTSIVTASGEIKPKTYTNLGANAQGRIMELMVKEGDHVHKGQVVARIESIQATADVEQQRATIASAESDSTASEAGLKMQDDTIKTQRATIDRTKADLELARVNNERYDATLQSRRGSKSGLRPAQIHLRFPGGRAPRSRVAAGPAHIATGADRGPDCNRRSGASRRRKPD